MAALDASGGGGEARIVSPALRRGVRMELVVAPVCFFLPALVAWVFVDLGLRHGAWPYIALGSIVFAGNVVFDGLMVRAALEFLRRTKPPRPARAAP